MELNKDFRELLELFDAHSVEWDEADRGKHLAAMGEKAVPVIGRREFIQNKRSCGRLKDLADIEALGEEVPGE